MASLRVMLNPSCMRRERVRRPAPRDPLPLLNRWGHAYVNPGPGFMFGKGGGTPAPDVIRRPFGRIAIGHSELQGHQNWNGAAAEGRRAVEALLKG